MYQGQSILINDFSGGYCGNFAASSLDLNQANDLDNIVITSSGKSFRARNGITLAFDSPNASTNITSLGLLYPDSTNIYMGAVSGTKFYTCTPVTFSSWTDRTGSLTITEHSQWSFVSFNGSLVGFGSNINGTVNAPFKWNGSGNAAALSGSAPLAQVCFTANNRLFAGNTVANPSTIYWNVIGNEDDWTGTGSGSAVVGSAADSQPITAAAVLNANTALIFKKDSIYQMPLTSAPFSVYPLFKDVGCVGKYAQVNVDGKIYFITDKRRMAATDGYQLETFPDGINNLWDTLIAGELENPGWGNIVGFRLRGSDYDWLCWQLPAYGSTTYLIIWDLLNKCWLRCGTGWKYLSSNVVYERYSKTYYQGSLADNGAVFAGGVFKLNSSSTYYDQSLESPGTLAAYWRSGWFNPGSKDSIVHPNRFLLYTNAVTGGTITVNYGFNFIADSASFNASHTPISSETITLRSSMLTGRGNSMNFKIGQTMNSSTNVAFAIHGIELRGKVYGQKQISAQ